MLNYLNYCFSPFCELFYDITNEKTYIGIPKNGSTSLRKLKDDLPTKFHYYFGDQPDEFIKKHNISEVTVFFRDPYERFVSALNQQSKRVDMSIDQLLSRINYPLTQYNFHFFDGHTNSQFSYLYRFPEHDKILFNFKPLVEISNVHEYLDHINYSIDIKLPDNFLSRDKINFFYTEDTVIYNQFINTSVYMKDIINQIQLETEFVQEMKKYCNIINYLK